MRWEEAFLQHGEKAAKNSVDIKETELGKVISINPLQINVGLLPLQTSNLVINNNLLDHKINFSEFTGTIDDITRTYRNGSIFIKSPLKEGDWVSCREMSNGMYYISAIVKVGGNIE